LAGIIAGMAARPDPSPVRVAGAPLVELVLRDDAGAPWVLTLSAAMERFIGAYPRIEGFDTGGPLIVFRTRV
jgi:hypothetical protein